MTGNMKCDDDGLIAHYSKYLAGFVWFCVDSLTGDVCC